MKFFIDTANINEIIKLQELDIVDGITTNPSLIAKSGQNFIKTIEKICKIVPGDVSAEVTSSMHEEMIKEGTVLSQISDNVVIKLPSTLDGIKACKYFSSKNIKTNMTLCFSVSQSLLAAKAGATYISPFIGRLYDIGEDGMKLIHDIVEMYDNYGYDTQVLAASIRETKHIEQAAIYGADVVTVPPKMIYQMMEHPLTDKGLKTFTEDWAKTGQKILK